MAKEETSSTPKSTSASIPTSEPSQASTLPEALVPVVDRRRRRAVPVSGDRPWETPLTAEDQQLGALVSRLIIQVPQRDSTRLATIESSVDIKDLVVNSSSVGDQSGRKTQANYFLPAQHPTPPAYSPPSQHDSITDSEVDTDDAPPGSSSNRQAPSPQNMNHANGVNGAVALPGIMAGLPTPAGHQSDLNYVYGMVEELSRTLAENRAASDRINAAVGRVRQRALELNMTNDEIVTTVASELNDSSFNLEAENSRLRRELDEANYEKKENLKLCYDYAKIMGDMLEKLHTFKLKTTLDMSAWHRSYRNQLAAEREENLNLRLCIADMQASAARGADALRQFRRQWEDDPEYNELRLQNIALRQEKRAWKRLALKEMDPNDSEFSDDDDEIDPQEKKRLKLIEAERIQKKREKEEGGGMVNDK